MYEITKFIGRRYSFKIGVSAYSGEFIGIGESDDEFGLLFANVTECGQRIPGEIYMRVPPTMLQPCADTKSRIKRLRAYVKKLFDAHKLRYFDDRWVNIFTSHVHRTPEYECI